MVQMAGNPMMGGVGLLLLLVLAVLGLSGVALVRYLRDPA